MNLQYIFTYHKTSVKNKKLLLLIAFFYILTILGFGIIGYSGDLSDTDNINNISVIALQAPIIICNNDKVTFLKLTSEAISLPLINKFSLLTRAPPV
jgi:hypothetical protein